MTFDADHYDLEKMSARYNEWVESIKVRYGYKTNKAIFKGMKSCTIKEQLGALFMMPSHHEKLEAWSGKGISERDRVIVSLDCDPGEIAAGLKRAFE